MSEELSGDGSQQDSPVEINPLSGRPTEIADSTVTRLNREGLRYSWEPIKIIDESREAMYKMPDGKSGIVLGPGRNTETWKQRGWQTLDIDPATDADIITDANLMEESIAPDSQDFILAERIRFDKKGREGVGRGRLLQQANKALKEGGKLIVQTAHIEGVPEANVPDRRWFAELMIQHGFETVEELQQISSIPGGVLEQGVIFYGVKKASGFESSRSQQK